MVHMLEESGSNLPVLYISGFTAESLTLRDQQRHAFLAKPFAPAELAAAVRRLLP